ncbi:fatty acid desaturase [Limibacillus halophilus]
MNAEPSRFAFSGDLNLNHLSSQLRKYREPSGRRAVMELCATVVPLAGLWIAAWRLHSIGYWWAVILLTIPAALFLVRLFMIQHDCGHGAFLKGRRANDWVGRLLGVLTMTPYDFWRQQHSQHHATSGNLNHRGVGDIDTLTVAEYRSLGYFGRLRYRLYRHPLVLFGLGPAYLFLLKHRLPIGLMRRGLRPWMSTMGTNAAIAGVAALLLWIMGPSAFLMVNLPIVLLAAAAGVWLFYIQHQFAETNWQTPPNWSLQQAALFGSSYYLLPKPLNWITANIAVHHVHHLNSRIPFYRLPQVLRDFPHLTTFGRVSLRESLSCVWLALWDEESQKLVSFAAARALAKCAPARSERIG